MSDKNELVASEIARLRGHADQVESVLVIVIEDLFRFGYFERIAADPIHSVVPQRHTPKRLVIPKGTEWPARERVLEHPFPPQLQECWPKN